MLVNGEGAVATHGSTTEDRLTPSYFTSDITDDDGSVALRMSFSDGTVKETVRSAAAAAADRVPVSEADRRGVVDPLDRGAARGQEAGDDVLAPATCNRFLEIFDGRRRYNLVAVRSTASKRSSSTAAMPGRCWSAASSLAADRRVSLRKHAGQIRGRPARHGIVVCPDRRHIDRCADPRVDADVDRHAANCGRPIRIGRHPSCPACQRHCAALSCLFRPRRANALTLAGGQNLTRLRRACLLPQRGCARS